MFTLNKPIIIRRNLGARSAYSYTEYSVGYKYISRFTPTIDVAFKVIYYGKAFVDADGYVDIDITDVIRNYALRHNYQYEPKTQEWIPDNYDFDGVWYPVEEDRWRTTSFVVNGEGWSHNLDITTFFFPEYYEDEEVENPYANNVGGIIPSINYSGILPHVPYVYTDRYFVGFESMIGSQDGSYTNNVDLETDTLGNLSLTMRGYGNYSQSLSLAHFFSSFQPVDPPVIIGGAADAEVRDLDIVSGGFANADTQIYIFIYGGGASTVVNPGDDTVTYQDRGIIAVDACPMKYYISWYTPFGEWQSQPLQSVTAVENSENFNISNTRRTLVNIENRSQARFQCKSHKLNKDEYRLFTTLMYSPYVVLYDVDRDKGYHCVLDTDSFTVKNRTIQPQFAEFTLRQIRQTIN